MASRACAHADAGAECGGERTKFAATLFLFPNAAGVPEKGKTVSVPNRLPTLYPPRIDSRPLSARIYTATDASGPPIISNPGENGCGQLEDGCLEESNVDPVTEYAILLKARHSW
jgi:hypothetical protein